MYNDKISILFNANNIKKGKGINLFLKIYRDNLNL